MYDYNEHVIKSQIQALKNINMIFFYFSGDYTLLSATAYVRVFGVK